SPSALSTLVLSSCCSNDTATTGIYTLSLHDALPILRVYEEVNQQNAAVLRDKLADADFVMIHDPQPAPLLHFVGQRSAKGVPARSEEHTSELQSRENLVCRLLLEKKNRRRKTQNAVR